MKIRKHLALLVALCLILAMVPQAAFAIDRTVSISLSYQTHEEGRDSGSLEYSTDSGQHWDVINADTGNSPVQAFVADGQTLKLRIAAAQGYGPDWAATQYYDNSTTQGAISLNSGDNAAVRDALVSGDGYAVPDGATEVRITGLEFEQQGGDPQPGGFQYYPGLWFSEVDVWSEPDPETGQDVETYEERQNQPNWRQDWRFELQKDENAVIKILYTSDGENFTAIAGDDPNLQYDHDLLQLEVVDEENKFTRVTPLDKAAIFRDDTDDTNAATIHYDADYGEAQNVSDLLFYESLPTIGLYKANSATFENHLEEWNYAADQNLTTAYLIHDGYEDDVVISGPAINWRFFPEENPISIATVTEGQVYRLTLDTTNLEEFPNTEYEFTIEYEYMDQWRDEPEPWNTRVNLLIPAYPHLYFAECDWAENPQTHEWGPVEPENPEDIRYYDGSDHRMSPGSSLTAQIVFFDGQNYNKLTPAQLTYDHDNLEIVANEFNDAYYDIRGLDFGNYEIRYTTGGKTYAVYVNAELMGEDFFSAIPASEETYLYNEWRYEDYQDVYFAVVDEHVTIVTPPAIEWGEGEEPFVTITEVQAGKVYKFSANAEDAAKIRNYWLDINYGVFEDYEDEQGWSQARDSFWGLQFFGTRAPILAGVLADNGTSATIEYRWDNDAAWQALDTTNAIDEDGILYAGIPAPEAAGQHVLHVRAIPGENSEIGVQESGANYSDGTPEPPEDIELTGIETVAGASLTITTPIDDYTEYRIFVITHEHYELPENGLQIVLNGDGNGTLNYHLGDEQDTVLTKDGEDPVRPELVTTLEDTTLTIQVEPVQGMNFEISFEAGDPEAQAQIEADLTAAYGDPGEAMNILKSGQPITIPMASNVGYQLIVTFYDPSNMWYSVIWGNEEMDAKIENGTVTVTKIEYGTTNTVYDLTDEQTYDWITQTDILEDGIHYYEEAEESGVWVRGDILEDLLAHDEAVQVTFAFAPDYGYQVSDVQSNGESILEAFAAGQELSSFSLRMDTFLHFSVLFVEGQNAYQINSATVTDAEIDGAEAGIGGNLKLTVTDLTAGEIAGLADEMKDLGDNTIYLDVDLYQVLSKGGDRGNWDDHQLTETEGTVTVTLAVPAPTEGEIYYVVCQHGEGNEATYDRIEAEYDPDTGTISFETNKFSIYAIASSNATVEAGDAIEGEIVASASNAIAAADRNDAAAVAGTVDNTSGSALTLAAAVTIEAEDYEAQAVAALEGGNIDTTDATVTVVPEVYYETTATVYTEEEITIDIAAKMKLYATVADPENEANWQNNAQKTVEFAAGVDAPVSGSVQISLELPADFVGDATTVYVKHVKADNSTYYYTATVSDGSTAESKTITFTNPNGFSAFSFTLTNQEPAQNPPVIGGGGSGSGSGSGEGSGDATTTPEAIFVDVAENAWYHDAVYYVREKGYFFGMTEDTFEPMTTMNRGMFAAVLYRVAGSPDSSATQTFPDVADGAYYAKAVAWAKAQGIINGYPDGSFDPTGAVSREQMAVMLWLLKGKPAGTGDLAQFSDADKIGGYAAEAVKWAVGVGILNGKGGGILDPKGEAKRAEVATLLMLFDQKVQ